MDIWNRQCANVASPQEDDDCYNIQVLQHNSHATATKTE